MVTRIALWCAPRPTPSPLLRAFTRRDDCLTSDEPLADPYLAYTRRYNGPPQAREAAALALWSSVINQLTGPPPVVQAGKALLNPKVWVQKHIARQLLMHTDRTWMTGLRHVFVLRDSRDLLAEAVGEKQRAFIEETSIPHQLEIYRWVKEFVSTKPVTVVERELLDDPKRVLRALCRELKLPFQSSMLRGGAAHVTGDACWYTESGLDRELPTGQGRASAPENADVIEWSDRMLLEMMESNVCEPDPETGNGSSRL